MSQYDPTTGLALKRVGADPRAAILSRIARDYNVAIYEVGAQTLLELAGQRDYWGVEQSDVGYHP